MPLLQRKTSLFNLQLFRFFYCLAVAWIASQRILYFWRSKDSGIFRGLAFISPFTTEPLSDTIVYGAVYLMVAALLAAGLGLWPRIMSVLSLLLYFNAFYPTDVVFQPYDSDIVFFNLLLLCFYPREETTFFSKRSLDIQVSTWPLDLIKLNLAIVYFAAFVAKIRNGGWEWANGETLRYYLVERSLMTGNPFAEFAGNHLWLCTILATGTLLSEAFFWLVLLPQRWLQITVALLGLSLHIGVITFMSINFKLYSITYLVFIPYDKILRRVRDWLYFPRSSSRLRAKRTSSTR